MSNFVVSLIRTVTPIIVGWLISLAASAGLDLEADALSGAVSSLLAAAYYVAARALERYDARLGWLLGYAAQPGYLEPPPAPEPPGTE